MQVIWLNEKHTSRLPLSVVVINNNQQDLILPVLKYNALCLRLPRQISIKPRLTLPQAFVLGTHWRRRKCFGHLFIYFLLLFDDPERSAECAVSERYANQGERQSGGERSGGWDDMSEE